MSPGAPAAALRPPQAAHPAWRSNSHRSGWDTSRPAAPEHPVAGRSRGSAPREAQLRYAGCRRRQPTEGVRRLRIPRSDSCLAGSSLAQHPGRANNFPASTFCALLFEDFWFWLGFLVLVGFFGLDFSFRISHLKFLGLCTRSCLGVVAFCCGVVCLGFFFKCFFPLLLGSARFGGLHQPQDLWHDVVS